MRDLQILVMTIVKRKFMRLFKSQQFKSSVEHEIIVHLSHKDSPVRHCDLVKEGLLPVEEECVWPPDLGEEGPIQGQLMQPAGVVPKQGQFVDKTALNLK